MIRTITTELWRFVKVALILLVLSLVAGLILWFVGGKPRLFFVFLALFSLALHAVVLLTIWLLVSAVVWRLLPRFLRDSYMQHRLRFRMVVLACLLLIPSVGFLVNKLWFPGILHPVSLVGDLVLVVLAVVLGWALMTPRKRSFAVFVSVTVIFAALIGLVRVLTPEPELARSDVNVVKKLSTLAYLDWVPAQAPDKSGVGYHDTTRTCPGLNIYNSANLAVAQLMTNSGEAVHEWSMKTPLGGAFRHIEMCANGDLLAILATKKSGQTSLQLVRLDWDSNLLWTIDGRYHHDICVAGNGDVYSLLAKDEVVSFLGMPLPIVNEYIDVLSPTGEFKRRIPLYELLANYMPRKLLRDVYTWLIMPKGWRLLADLIFKSEHNYHQGRHTPLSPFHANTVEMINRDTVAGISKGDLLFCVRNMDFVGVINSEETDVIFSWGPGHLQRPHHPSLLESDNILIYDNGPYRRFTRIVEVNPVSGEIVWEHKADPPNSFYSSTKGSCQRLVNGNTLITNSNSGQVFEVTSDGELVWEFDNPEIVKEKRATIYRFMRIDNEDDYPGLAAAGISAGTSTHRGN